MSRGVRGARNTLIGFAVFMIAVGTWMLIGTPTHWHDWLTQFGGAFFCVSLVRAVNRESRAQER